MPGLSPHCAVPRRRGWDLLPGVRLARGWAPTLRSTRRLVSAAPTGLRAGGTVGPGTGSRQPGGWPARLRGATRPVSGMERWHRGSWRARMACIPAAAPVPRDDVCWPGSSALAGGQEARVGVMGRTTPLVRARCCRRALVSAEAKRAAAPGKKGLDGGMCVGTGMSLSRVYGVVKKTQEIGSS